MITRKILGTAAICAALIGGAATHAEAPRIGLKLVAEGLVSPTAIISIPGQKGAMLITDQPGTIHRLADGKLSEKVVLDLRPKMAELKKGFDERGLIGFALHPDFASNQKVYVVYNAPLRKDGPAGWNSTMTLSEFTANENATEIQSDSEKILLEVDKPYFNHNGGCIVFGPDGYLYMSTGDGGNANDEDERGKPLGRPAEGNGQNLQALLGKMLRLDVNRGAPYEVPKDNPFVGKEGRPEIYAYGLRNVWRFSIDRGGDREIFAADVGQDLYEEVNIIKKGGNYGWRIREGSHCFDPRNPKNPPENCAKTGAGGEPLIDPILEYKHSRGNPNDLEGKGISIAGGYVYRGKAIKGLEGKYVFGDWSRNFVKPDGVLFVAGKGKDGKWSLENVVPESHKNGLPFIIAFGEDADGELYVLANDTNGLTGRNGRVFKITPP